MSDKIIAVTGANRGIGLEICRALASQGQKVVLTSRNEDKGKHAQVQLADEDLSVEFHQLDVEDAASIDTFVEDLQNTFGRLDVLINNAGILEDSYSDTLSTDRDLILRTLDINAVGAFDLSCKVVPLMREHGGHIINVSSGMGSLRGMGMGNPAYRMSKAAMNAATLILHAELHGSGIAVNAMSPGWVRTEMGGSNAHRSIEQGADTAVWLALQDDPPSGKFFRDRQVTDW